ncbi:hypothetical protein [Qiania dongpingensis]|uniref:Secreted protein n=1 Tax=Qiania dongpingensis TaxID=2763669 RepID=A0A7G9G750_9FIRM|nr:hypothetical protein [Qiania dongpingensis]QNM06632.1 hypothetical protein H9Q78_05835 [Qiania dongpingensis]
MKRKILILLMSAMTLMLFSVTSFAASYNKTSGTISGTLKTYSTYASAGTTNTNGNAYVSVRVKYNTSSGGTYWSSKAENSGSSYANTSRSISGTVIGAESGHGASKSSVSFNLP